MTEQQHAVDKLGVADQVLEMYKADIPVKKIHEALAIKGIDISAKGITRWLNNLRDPTNTTVAPESKAKYEVMVIDYKKEICGILDEVKEVRLDAKAEKDYKIYDKMIGRLYQGIELLAKISGAMNKHDTVDVNIVIDKITDRVFDENKDVRNSLHSSGIVIDAEAEIIKDDKEREAELRKHNE
jgi:hypothetical protein